MIRRLSGGELSSILAICSSGFEEFAAAIQQAREELLDRSRSRLRVAKR